MKRGRTLEEEKPEFERMAKRSRYSYILFLQDTQMQMQTTYEEHIRKINQKMLEMEARVVMMERLLATFVAAYQKGINDKWNSYIS